MKIYEEITVDLTNPYPLPKMKAQQGNTGRGAKIKLTHRRATIQIDKEIVNLYAKLPNSMNMVYLSTKLEDGLIVADFSNVMLSEVGNVQVELQIIDNEQEGATQITTPIFIVEVNPSNIAEGEIVASSEFSALVDALADVQEYKANGLKGDKGDSATIQVGTVETLEPNQKLIVENVGTVHDAVFNFGIPKGEKGESDYKPAVDALEKRLDNLKSDLDKLDTLFETGKNLFNPNTLKEFKSIGSNGNIVDANTEGNMFDISDFISVKAGETVYFSHNNDPISVLYAFSTDTSDTGWIRATANNYTASADGYIILRFTHASPIVEKMQVEIGTGVTFFEPFHYEIERYENKFGGIGGLSLANKYPLSDANEAENNRVYSIAYTGCNNLPVNGMQGTLITFQCGSNSGRTQMFIRAVSNIMYVRHYWTAWSNWSEIVDKSALNTVKSDIESKIPSVAYASVSMFEKIAIIGDSYASGEIYKQTDTDYNYTSSDGTHYYVKDYYNLSWLQVMARKNGVSGVNLSVGGLSTRTWLTNKNGLQKMLTEEAQNLYIMGLGINDVGKLGTSYIGSVSDINDTDYTLNADTFYGNYGKIIEQVKNHAPNCKIIMMAMANNTNATYVAYNTAIVNIANHYNIPVIKQYDDEFFLSDFYKNHMINGHPTADVYSGMALAIDRLICDAIKNDYSYFVDYVG